MINEHKVAEHFDIDMTYDAFSFARKQLPPRRQPTASMSRTSLPKEAFDDAATVRSYKSPAFMERAFRCIKTVDLQVRPVYHRLADRVRAHAFLCTLAYYLEWHMRRRLAPMLIDDTVKAVAEASRVSEVAQAKRTPAAAHKQATGLTEDGTPVHSLRTLLADLATVARNILTTAVTPNHPLTVVTEPTTIQLMAFQLLGANCSQ